MSFIDWPVFARQLALVFVPLLVSKGIVPAYLADPAIELLAYLLGTVLVGWVIWLGQKRESPAAKIEAVASLPEVRVISLNDADMAADIPSGKVIP